MNLQKIIEWLDEFAPDIHKTYDTGLGWCYISDTHGNRRRITGSITIGELRQLVQQIRDKLPIKPSI